MELIFIGLGLIVFSCYLISKEKPLSEERIFD
jgi:hypothetical protein